MAEIYRQRQIKWTNKLKLIVKEIWLVSIFQKTKKAKQVDKSRKIKNLNKPKKYTNQFW